MAWAAATRRPPLIYRAFGAWDFMTRSGLATSPTRGGFALPIVDVATLRDGSATGIDKAAVAQRLDQAFVEKGFCYIKGHGIPDDLLENVLKNSREFFALPLTTKSEMSIQIAESGAPVRGYQALRENVTQGAPDMHEAIDFYSENLPAAHKESPLGGKNKWPQTLPCFRPTFEAYFDSMLALGSTIFAALESQRPELGQLKFDNPFWVCRTIRYEPISDKDASNLGCGSHTDYGCFTFVHADDVPGCLQVQDSKGTWHDVPCVPGAFVCNIGDMLSLALNGTYRSTTHRVLAPAGNTDRVSCPFFFEPNYDCQVNGVVYGSHLEQRVLSNFASSPHLDKNLER